MAATDPRIGVDFDNTIVSYDTAFWRVAMEQKLVPSDIPAAKSAIRDYLRKTGREDAWTAMQGVVYGKRMVEAEPFPGVLDFFRKSSESNLQVCIISHRTRHPIVGEQYDLHAAAGDWLREHGVYDCIPRERVFFELTRQSKVERINTTGCTHFIDDLPEVLADAGFPRNAKRILFDPQNAFTGGDGILPMSNWRQIETHFQL